MKLENRFPKDFDIDEITLNDVLSIHKKLFAFMRIVEAI